MRTYCSYLYLYLYATECTTNNQIKRTCTSLYLYMYATECV